jgi:hypothetical protein
VSRSRWRRGLGGGRECLHWKCYAAREDQGALRTAAGRRGGRWDALERHQRACSGGHVNVVRPGGGEQACFTRYTASKAPQQLLADEENLDVSDFKICRERRRGQNDDELLNLRILFSGSRRPTRCATTTGDHQRLSNHAADCEAVPEAQHSQPREDGSDPRLSR